MKLYVVVCFFIDLIGGGHFEVSAKAYTSLAACDEFAAAYAEEMASKVTEVWTQCLPVPGIST